MDALILGSAVIILVAFLIALPFAWKYAYWDHPEYNRLGMRKHKAKVLEHDPTGMDTYKEH